MRRSLFVGTGLACLLALSGASGLRWNASPSVAPGLYLERTSPLERGDLVAVCLPEVVGRWARHRGYLPGGRCEGDAAPVGKRVAALEGDLIEVTQDGVEVDGRLLDGSTRIARDARGRRVPLLPEGAYVVAPGQMWLHSGRHERSLDSRVFGPLQVDQIEGVLEPLWVAKED